MIAETFEVEGQRLKLLVDEAQAKFDSANADMATCQNRIDGAKADLQAKLEEIKEKEAILAEDVENTKEAKDELKETTDQQKAAEEAKSVLSMELEKYQSAKVESFDTLWEGCWENIKEQKQHLSVLTPIFKKLSADVSLIGALPSALGKKPEERGDFDNMVVRQLREFFAAQIETAGARLQDAAATLESQEAEVDAKQVVLEAYQEKQEDREASIAVAKIEQEEKEAALEKADLAGEAQQGVVKSAADKFELLSTDFKAHQDMAADVSWLVQEYVSTQEAAPTDDAPMAAA